MTGIIELGENSVTLWIYKHDNDRIIQVLTMKKAVGLIGYIESGALTPKGIAKACAVLVYYDSILNKLGIENIYVFASPFMKNVTNFKETIEQIQERTGFYVMSMSGDEKAELAYYGAAQSLPLQTGVFVDIGGGYTEIAVFKDRQVRQAWSIPYGSLNLSLKYIKGITPLKSHIQSIKKDLKRELKRMKLTEVADRYDICVTGGTAEATGDLYNDIYDLADNHVLDSEKLADMLIKYNEERRDFNKRIKRLSPDRIHTLIPGIIILSTIARLWQSRNIYVTSFGVSDGYYLKNIMHSNKNYDFSQI